MVNIQDIEVISNKIGTNMSHENDVYDKLTKDEIRVLLKKYLKEDIYVKSIMETFSREELNNWLRQNKVIINHGK